LIRQRKIADKAESLEKQHGTLTMTVLKPDNTQAAIKALHAKFMRRVLMAKDEELAGLWTIEKGEQFGRLHINVLATKPLTIPKKWDCETYSETVRVLARDAAAYISKRKGMPEPQQYSGRLYGSFGKVSDILASEQVAPVVQAAAIEVALGGGDTGMQVNGVEYRTAAEEAEGWIEGVPVKGRRVWFSSRDSSKWTWKPPYPSAADHREIAMRNLPKLREAIAALKKRQH
jgi:hypothetical protein